MPRPPDPDDRVLEVLARSVPRAGDACPSDDFVGGWVEGRLSDAERTWIEHHAARCDACRELARALAPKSRAERAPAGRFTNTRLRVAAALLLGVVGLGTGVALWKRRGAAAVEPGLEGRIVVAAADLARRHPGLFADFRPLDADERRGGVADRLRGGADTVVLLPAGVTRSTRPRLSWETPRSASGEPRVTLLSDQGTPIWAGKVDASQPAGRARSAPFPAGAEDLEPGRRYIVELRFDGPLGPVSGRRVFEVAAPESGARVGRQLEAIASAAGDAAVHALLRAQVALRAGILDEAEESARAAVLAAPADASAVETLARIRRELGAE